MDKDEFWATKSPLPEYQAITFAHPAFVAPIRIVANVFAPVTLSGNVHVPAAMTIKPPESGGDVQPKLVMHFPRLVVGRTFKQHLALIVAAGSRAPIVVTYAVYTGDVAAPSVTWVLYASDSGGVTFTAESVQVAATLDNPMLRAVAPIYDPAVFTGLRAL